MRLFVFNLSVAAFDDAGKQVPELQESSLASVLAERLKKHGIDPTSVVIETPNNNLWTLVAMENGEWNYKTAPTWT